jgi:hypothetical protein
VHICSSTERNEESSKFDVPIEEDEGEDTILGDIGRRLGRGWEARELDFEFPTEKEGRGRRNMIKDPKKGNDIVFSD